jgi:hypothetical protein
MDLNGNSNFQVEFWEPGVCWITHPDDIPMLDEQWGARVDREGEVLMESGRKMLSGSSHQDLS